MTNATFYVLYSCGSLLLFAASIGMKKAWSGKAFTTTKHKLAFTFNTLCIFFHLNFLQNGQVLFLGERDNSIIGWLSLALVLTQGLNLPAEGEPKHWFRRKRLKNTMMLNNYPGRSATNAEKFFNALGVVFIIATTSLVGSGAIVMGLNWLITPLITLTPVWFTTLWIVISVVIAMYCIASG